MHFLLLALIDCSCLTRDLSALQLYAELLLARFALLDNPSAGNTPEPDAGVREAVTSIIYAAPRVEVKGAFLTRRAQQRIATGLTSGSSLISQSSKCSATSSCTRSLFHILTSRNFVFNDC
jgi:hypothetical protein